MDQHELGAHEAIADAISRDFIAIDHREWDLLRTCVAPGVTGIHQAVEVAGGIRG